MAYGFMSIKSHLVNRWPIKNKFKLNYEASLSESDATGATSPSG